MNKETHSIQITLVLPRYEVMAIIHALQKQADFEYRSGEFLESRGITELADKISNTVREQFAAFENQPK